MKRFGYAMGVQMLAFAVYGLAVWDTLFYPGSDLRAIVGMILAARVIEAVTGVMASSQRSRKFLLDTMTNEVSERLHDKLTAWLERRLEQWCDQAHAT